jgi:alpha-D-ribose 1-methylphosphonate 5-triphosphate synthase subunit PhnI
MSETSHDNDKRMNKERPQIAVAQLGARMHYAVPRILEEAGMLDLCRAGMASTASGDPKLVEA